jgi:hypothetical protein
MPAVTPCSSCLRILPTSKEHEASLSGARRIMDHYDTLKELEASAQSCPLCASLLEMVRMRTWEDDPRPPEQFKFYISDIGQILEVSFTWMPFNRLFTFVMCRGEPRLHLTNRNGGENFSAEQPIWNSDTPISFDDRWPLVQEWLDSCATSHAGCSEFRKSGYLPTRLVELNLSTENPSVRLVESQSLDAASTSYTTLSHRWSKGEEMPLRTLQATLDQHRDIIPLDRIPPTFLDAMKITAKLRLSYIWIDSLCIIQDNHLDWEREASKMCDVYQNSYLTIAAVDSIGPSGGCFLEPLSPRIHISRSNVFSEELNVRVPAHSENDISQSALLSRGWVFQELVLSPRVLYCETSGFYWQCRRGSWSEDGLISAWWPLNFHLTLFNPATSKMPIHTWAGWMTEYSRLKFTFKSDRPVAMTGVTRWFQQRYHATPFLGCWKEELVYGLNWLRLGSYPPDSEETHASPNLPSWSWLGLAERCAIDIVPPGNLLKFVEVLDSQLQWSGEELTSAVVSSRLVVKS